jgi:hypothetical protein
MNIGRGVIVATMTAAAVMGITLPAYAAAPGGQAPAKLTRHECENGGGKSIGAGFAGYYCAGGKYNSQQVTSGGATGSTAY